MDDYYYQNQNMNQDQYPDPNPYQYGDQYQNQYLQDTKKISGTPLAWLIVSAVMLALDLALCFIPTYKAGLTRISLLSLVLKMETYFELGGAIGGIVIAILVFEIVMFFISLLSLLLPLLSKKRYRRSSVVPALICSILGFLVKTTFDILVSVASIIMVTFHFTSLEWSAVGLSLFTVISLIVLFVTIKSGQSVPVDYLNGDPYAQSYDNQGYYDQGSYDYQQQGDYGYNQEPRYTADPYNNRDYYGDTYRDYQRPQTEYGNQSMTKYGQNQIDAAGSTNANGNNRVGRLTCLAGAYQGAGFPILHNETIAFGKDPMRANIIIEDARVSALHCTVRYDAYANMYDVTDFSTNGTYLITGDRLPKNRLTRLSPGAKICIYNKSNIFELG